MSKSIYELKHDVQERIIDTERRAEDFINKYINNLPTLPDFDKIREIKILYFSYNTYIGIVDELMEVLLRLNLIEIHLDRILSEGLPRDLTNYGAEIKELGGWLRRKRDINGKYITSLVEIKRSVEHKIKFMQSLLYKGDI